MAQEDERAQWLLARVLVEFDPQPGDETLDYVRLLWRLQALNARPAYPRIEEQAGEPRKKPLPEGDEGMTPTEERAVREALDYLAPRQDDRLLAHGDLAQRLLRVVDRELFRCTSALEQVLSPTGAVVLPPEPRF